MEYSYDQMQDTFQSWYKAIMKVSGRTKYHATLETFNAEIVMESEMLDGEQAGLFRSGLGPRPDFVHGDGQARHPICSESPIILHGSSYREGTFGIENIWLHILKELQMMAFSYGQLKKARWSVAFGKRMTLSRMKLQFQIGRPKEDSFWKHSAILHGLIAKQLAGLPVQG